MKHTRSLILMLMWATGLCGLQAQHTHPDLQDISKPLPCRADDHNRAYYETHPEALIRNKQIKKNKALTRARPDAYVIPVVFHIFGEDFYGKKITDAIIADALEKTNKDFQGLTSNWGDPNPTFDRIKRSLNITFKLAQKDPQGNATTGIIYHPVESGFGNYWHPKLPQYAWDNYSYMNVYIMVDLYGDNVTNNSGVSWYPDKEMSDKNLARVTYNPLYIGTNTDENFRRVLTHEFGHFLNLAHTFDYDSKKFADGCSDAADGTPNPGDYVDDTPAANKMLMTENDLNCHNQKTNWTNFMNYTDRYSMFTIGQVARMKDGLDHEARITLWSKANIDKVFFTQPTPRIALSKNEIKEAVVNDGSFASCYKFTVIDATVEAGKTFTYNTDFTIANLPEGLTAKLVSTSDNSLELSFEGKAVKHLSSNNIEKLSITLNNSIIKSGTLYKNTFETKLSFRDPYQITYNDVDDVEINAGFPWKFIRIDDKFKNSDFGIWFEKNKLRLETYKKKIICEGTSRNISLLKYGDVISRSSNWVAGGDYPDEHDIYSSSYTAWKGKTGFIGFQFEGENKGEALYGWMKISVSEDGKSYTLKDFAYNQSPLATIVAGQKDSSPLVADLSFSNNIVKEDALSNNGTISRGINFEILGNNSFNKIGELVLGTDYILKNIPNGLTPKLVITDATKGSLIFTGKASAHEGNNSVSTKLEFQQSLFTDKNIKNITQPLDIYFLSKYTIVTEQTSYHAGSKQAWDYFRIVNINAEYGAWQFKTGHLKLQTYSKPAICYDGTKNLKPLAENTEIGPNSKWTTPVDQYEGVLDIHTGSFTEWRGRTAYIGIRIPYEGSNLYGWMKLKVEPNGLDYTVLEYAYSEAPEQPIFAGQKVIGKIQSSIIASNCSVNEDEAINDGTVTTSATFDLLGDNQFKGTDKLIYGTDYIITNLPKGLTPELTIVSSSKATLSFTGKAATHEVANNVATKIEFRASAFTNEVANKIFDLNFKFFDKVNTSKIVSKIVDYTADEKNVWKSFRIDEIGGKFGIWLPEVGNIKLETYGNPSICKSGTLNIIPIALGTEIGEKSQWTTPENRNILDVTTSEYKEWIGKTAYIAFKIPFEGKSYYGWFKTSVSEDGKSISILEWAYNGEAGKSIWAGEKIVKEGTGINATSSEIMVYPNPVSDELTVKTPIESLISIYNTKGELVFSTTADTESTCIKVQSFVKGFYLVRITNDNITYVKKIIVK